MTGPLHGVARAFHLDLGSKFQALPLGTGGQHKLRLSDLAGQRIPRIQTTALQYLSVPALVGRSQHARNTGNAVVGETDNQPEVPCVFIAPDQ